MCIFQTHTHSIRKDRGNLHSRYQELLQQKKEHESKLLALQQKQAQMMDGMANASRVLEVKWPAGATKFLFDSMDESAERHMSKGNIYTHEVVVKLYHLFSI